MKVSIIGAGNVGSTLAERVLANNMADVVLVDIVEGLAQGKALDLNDAAPVMGYKKSIIGRSTYEETRDSKVVVITAGLARKPGMTREELVQKNTSIVTEVLKNVKKYSPDSIVVIVTNPLDIMTWLAYKTMNCGRGKVLGMAGTLDTARFKALLSEELGLPPAKIEAYVLGSHGDTMVPLVSKTLVDGKPLSETMSHEKIARVVERTKKRGGEIVSLLKAGSAYYSPSAACFEILKAIIKDEGKIMPCSCIAEGEYGIEGCSIGLPAKIGKDGILQVIEWELPDEELSALKNSALDIKKHLEELGK